MAEHRITIKAARVNAGLSQSEAAEKSGVGMRSLQRIERGQVIPRWDVVVKLAKLYRWPTYLLNIGGNEDA